MFRVPLGVSRDSKALVLLPVRNAAVEVELSAKCDVLLRTCALAGALSSSSSRYVQKLAFDAVVGVLGVLDTWLEGVRVFRSSASRSFNASIFVVMGVPKGRRFNGGSFSDCKPLRPTTVEVRVRESGVFVARSAAYSPVLSPVALARS